MDVALVNIDGVSKADLGVLENDRLAGLLLAALEGDAVAMRDRPAWESFI